MLSRRRRRGEGSVEEDLDGVGTCYKMLMLHHGQSEKKVGGLGYAETESAAKLQQPSNPQISTET